jgi:uncharacterized protein YcsI (UPF0317 family)
VNLIRRRRHEKEANARLVGDAVQATLIVSERRLALKLSKLCLEKPAECPGYMADVEAKPKQNGKVD